MTFRPFLRWHIWSFLNLCAGFVRGPYRGSKALWHAYWLSAFQQHSFSLQGQHVFYSYSFFFMSPQSAAMCSCALRFSAAGRWAQMDLYTVSSTWSIFLFFCLLVRLEFNMMAMNITFKLIIYMLDLIKIDLWLLFIIIIECFSSS